MTNDAIRKKISDLTYSRQVLVSRLNLLEPDDPVALSEIDRCIAEIDRLERTLAVREAAKAMRAGLWEGL